MSATRQALERGQRRYRQQQRQEAIRRGKAFLVWKEHHFDRAHTPAELPTDHDFRLFKERAR